MPEPRVIVPVTRPVAPLPEGAPFRLEDREPEVAAAYFGLRDDHDCADFAGGPLVDLAILV